VFRFERRTTRSGRAVLFAAESGRELNDLSLDEFRKFSEEDRRRCVGRVESGSNARVEVADRRDISRACLLRRLKKRAGRLGMRENNHPATSILDFGFWILD
jgi:transposase-like protein